MLSLVRLKKLASAAQKLASVAHETVAENLPTAARLSGLHVQGDRVALGFGSVQVTALALLLLYAPGSLSTGAAIAGFVAALALRFGFLFTSFTPNGIARRLTARLGVERGHAVYAAALDLVLFAQRASFIALACATALEPSGLIGEAVQVLGAPLVLVGAGATIWAARVLGLDAYHYRDLFTNARHVNIENGGPYLLCSNPMYALGPLAGYGLALVTLSPIALLAAATSQALLFAFNATVEQPRLQRAHSIFLETQRRYELARTLLGFDPREELAQRRHWVEQSPPAVEEPSQQAT